MEDLVFDIAWLLGPGAIGGLLVFGAYELLVRLAPLFGFEVTADNNSSAYYITWATVVGAVIGAVMTAVCGLAWWLPMAVGLALALMMIVVPAFISLALMNIIDFLFVKPFSRFFKGK